MAFVAAYPVLTAILASTAVATVASGYMAAQQQRNAGIQADNQAQAQARAEGDAAKGREITRRQDLMRALSSQNAAAGAAGISTDGSFGGVVRTNIKQNQQDLLTDAAGVSARRQALLDQGSNARRAGAAQARGTLFDTAISVGQQAVGSGMVGGPPAPKLS